ncbi:binding-protein-dependent transport systems inner membrane component [Methanococcus vannielii SB]|uniref:Molybdate/tungstate transport system permease protein WtpB n=1 Tax=Methanococcus vannielii (strain ATCC 35089 / DSM 1224 / JCM 13029 / OCM 148 / SB) TaxID=406327 RepID=A6UQG6_METVS|nr:tungstate ABC transporter permease WtpB [Methanococcus vannielii]ABR54738.1 binding-protein-dependent transport systems inner membrane component [Methanococcus vannielii SB]
MNQDKSFFTVFIVLSALLLLFLVLPLLNMILNPGNIQNAIFDSEVINSLLISLKAAGTATVIALYIGVPISYLLSRYHFFGKNVVEAIIDIPMAIPHAVIGIMILAFYYGTSIGRGFESIGFKIVDNFWGIVTVMLYVGLPYMVNSARDGFLMVDEELENVSRTLGASRAKTFFKISLPLIKNNIVSGSILTFARGISEVGAILVIAYFPKTAPVLILDRFNQYGLTASKPISVIMIILSILLFSVFRLVRYKQK